VRKFRNIKTVYEGHKFDSQFERDIFIILKTDPDTEVVELQPRVYLTAAKILCKPDFKCRNKKTGEYYFAEAKGFETPSWRIKRRLWQFYGPLDMVIYKTKGRTRSSSNWSGYELEKILGGQKATS